MKTRSYIIVVFAASLLLSFSYKQQRVRILMAGDSTMSVKETTAYPETGWGMPFRYFWDSTVEVINLAMNGRSTKSFIAEGRWDKLISQAWEGDYVFIEFGHNDEAKEKAERYTSPEDYRANLTRFINDVRNRKAVPVLLTPVSRRQFEKDGTVKQTHAVYSPIVRQMASSMNVVLIDLDEISRGLYARAGEEGSRRYFLQLKPGEHPNYPSGKEDNTHFNELGARLVAQEVLAALRNSPLELKGHIIKSARP